MNIFESLEKFTSTERGEQALRDWIIMIDNGADQLDPDAWDCIIHLCQIMKSGGDRAIIDEISDQLDGRKF